MTTQDTRTPAITGLEPLSTLGEVRYLPEGLSIECDDADFLVRVPDGASDPVCETQWEVTVREPAPGLSTWWGQWDRSWPVRRADAGPLIVEELGYALSRVRAMLADHARSAEGAA